MLSSLKNKNVVITVSQNWFGNKNTTTVHVPLSFNEDDHKIELLVNNLPRITIIKSEITRIHKRKNCVVFITADRTITIKKETFLDRIRHRELRC